MLYSRQKRSEENEERKREEEKRRIRRMERTRVSVKRERRRIEIYALNAIAKHAFDAQQTTNSV